jgi:hypothetical protein
MPFIMKAKIAPNTFGAAKPQSLGRVITVGSRKLRGGIGILWTKAESIVKHVISGLETRALNDRKRSIKSTRLFESVPDVKGRTWMLEVSGNPSETRRVTQLAPTGVLPAQSP